MTPGELADLSMRISALERVVERLAETASGPAAERLSERRQEIEAVFLDPNTMGDIKRAISFERVLLRGVQVR